MNRSSRSSQKTSRGNSLSHPRQFGHQRPGRTNITQSIFPTRRAAAHFTDLPPPKNNPPYHLTLDDVLSRDEIKLINEKGSISFHAVGDTGGINNETYQQINAEAMEADFSNINKDQSSFFYHLGDVVYYAGEANHYYGQFYEPYQYYPKPIFAIPGNHDGLTLEDPSSSLAAFIDNFCADEPHITKDAGSITRDAMTQPYVYWTLDAPFVIIVGLYSNTDEYEGDFDQNQIKWFVNELKTAPKNKALIVAVHHPAYSGDSARGSSGKVAKALDDAFDRAHRRADLVLSGHVHNYQRFTRLFDGEQVPYIVAGAGGYPAKHYLLRDPDGNKIEVPFNFSSRAGVNLTLENYSDNRFGYLHLHVTDKIIKGEYIATAYHNEAFHAESEQVDNFELDWHQHKLKRGGSTP
jgi:predicted phosphodiesterase